MIPINKRFLFSIAILVVILALSAGIYWNRTVISKTLRTIPLLNTVLKPTTNQQPVATNMVEIKKFAFQPPVITVKPGTTVAFINRDGVAHTATGNDESFDTGLLGRDEQATVTFDQPGRFEYHCIPHPFMQGTVMVE